MNWVGMLRSGWLVGIVLIVVGAVIGAAAIVASTVVDRFTATEAFCTGSCHVMALQAENPAYGNSPHRANAFGVLAGCSDCHIPTNNWFVETYTHVTSGMRDAFVELTGNVNDPAAWAKRRVELRQEVLQNASVAVKRLTTVEATMAVAPITAPNPSSTITSNHRLKAFRPGFPDSFYLGAPRRKR